MDFTEIQKQKVAAYIVSTGVKTMSNLKRIGLMPNGSIAKVYTMNQILGGLFSVV